MADAIISVAAERLIALVEEQAVYHVNLVRGAENEVHSLSNELNTIRNVLNDAENRRFHDKNINSWLSRLEHKSYQMEDILDEWNYALLKRRLGAPRKKVFSLIPSPSCLCFKRTVVRHHIATKILNVKTRLDEIFVEKDRYGFVVSQATTDPLPKPWRDQSTSSIYLGDVLGRDREVDIVVSKLMATDGCHEQSGIPVVSIVGLGGLGKTTLAQLVYNHSQVEKYFDLRIWICVSDPFDLTVISKGILESIKMGSSRDVDDQLDVLFKLLRESISGKKFLIVLDDVWSEDYKKWEPLKNLLRCGRAGSKILVTTRSKRVAVIMGTRDSEIFQLGVLSDENCWLVLCRMALWESDRVEFEDIGKKIVQKCCGLPLAAKTLGGLLRFKKTLREWENVLNSEIWEMQEAEDELFRPLLMTYKELSPTQKQCFLYCAVFPKDYEIDVETLIGKWMALGYLGSSSDDMELKGKECFDFLVMRSLFQDFKNIGVGTIGSCKMHDIVHDFAQFLKKRGGVEAVEMNKTTCGVCNPSLVSTVNEFFSLHCEIGSMPSNICGCLVPLRVLRFPKSNMESVPLGMDTLIHLRWLELYKHNLSTKDLKIIFQLYFLQTLKLPSCNLQDKIPKEIENLYDLRHLNFSDNDLSELPSEIGNLENLRHLDVSGNPFLTELPSEIGKLENLRHLDVSDNTYLKELPSEIGKLVLLQTLRLPDFVTPFRIPETLAQLKGLRTLIGFKGGIGWSKLGLLKNLNQLDIVTLYITLDVKDLKGMVEEAREARLSSKRHIEELLIAFEMDEEEALSSMEESSLSSSMMEILDALEPHPNLKSLQIKSYCKASKFPLWLGSSANQLTNLHLKRCHATSLPSLGELPCLEEIKIDEFSMLEFVGREFLGKKANTNFIAFPKLKKLEFGECPKWKEWEDITAEEEESASFRVMPFLKVLNIKDCSGMTLLPHRLLRKALSLETLALHGSRKLDQRYHSNEDDSDRKAISLTNPSLRILVRR